MGKIGRNDPCPCGSGKKYKKCCINKEVKDQARKDEIKLNEYDKLISQGGDYVLKGNSVKACSIWNDVWAKVKNEKPLEIKSISELDEHFKGQEFLYNWCQDYEMELGNAGIKEPKYFEIRITYCREFVTLLPKSDNLIIFNMKKAEAESYFALGRLNEGESAFQSLIKEHPQSAWGYIGWGDMYWLYRVNNKIPLDYDKAEKIYREALTKGVDSKKDVLERLKDLEEEKKNPKIARVDRT